MNQCWRPGPQPSAAVVIDRQVETLDREVTGRRITVPIYGDGSRESYKDDALGARQRSCGEMAPKRAELRSSYHSAAC